MDEIRKSQQELCMKYRAPFIEPQALLKIAFNKNFDVDNHPINGLRHPPEGDATGWYVWNGEWSDAADFLSHAICTIFILKIMR